MSEQRRELAAPLEPYFDRTPQPFGDGPPDPVVYDASPRALRQRTVNFAAKRFADMRMSAGSTAPPPSGISVGGRLQRREGLGSATRPKPRQNSPPPSAVAT